MPSDGVIEPFEIAGNLGFGLTSCFERGAPHQLRIDGFEEGSHDGIVIAIALTGHGNDCAYFLQSISVFYGAILATAVRMMY